jgi:hypothetical protein
LAAAIGQGGSYGEQVGHCPSNFKPGTSGFELSYFLTRIFHELLSRDREDGRATRQPQGAAPEDPWKDGHIRGCSKSFMKHSG